MAAVYNVPLGGALFSVEVLLGTLALPLVLPALLTSLVATAISWIGLPHTPTCSDHVTRARKMLGEGESPAAVARTFRVERTTLWRAIRRQEGAELLAATSQRPG